MKVYCKVATIVKETEDYRMVGCTDTQTKVTRHVVRIIFGTDKEQLILAMVLKCDHFARYEDIRWHIRDYYKTKDIEIELLNEKEGQHE